VAEVEAQDEMCVVGLGFLEARKVEWQCGWRAQDERRRWRAQDEWRLVGGCKGGKGKDEERRRYMTRMVEADGR
jgi:hypothetical protein